MARLLTSMGVPCGHEAIFTPRGLAEAQRRLNGESPITLSECSTVDVLREKAPIEKWVDENSITSESSYMAVPYLNRPELKDAKVIHVVRHPLEVISSFIKDLKYFGKREPNKMQHWSFDYEFFIWKHLPELQNIPTQIERACYFYVEWNDLVENLVESNRKLFVKIETDYLQSLCDFLNVPMRRDYFNNNKINSIRIRQSDFSLSDIPNGIHKKRFLAMAERYGYQLSRDWVAQHPVSAQGPQGSFVFEGAQGSQGS